MSDNMITIVQPPHDDSCVRLGNDTKFFMRDGTEILQVTRAVVTFGVDEAVMATMDIAIDQVENIEAHPLLSLESLRVAADHYGMQLVKKDNNT